MSWPLLGLIGGLVGVDATSFPQVMISRPIVAGTLAGWALGDPAAGALLGALHELFNLAVLPVGAARYPEPGTATVAATAGLLMAPNPAAWTAVLVALVFALAWERLAGRSVILFRRGIEHLLFDGGPGRAAGLERRHLLAIVLDFVRAGAVTLIGAAAAAVIVGALAARIALPDYGVQAGIAIAAGAALGGTLGIFGGWSERRTSLLIGALAGCGLLLLTR